MTDQSTRFEWYQRCWWVFSSSGRLRTADWWLFINQYDVILQKTWIFVSILLSGLTYRRRWGDNIKIYLKKIDWEDVDWTDLSRSMNTSQALVNAVMKFQCPQNLTNLLIIRGTIFFSRTLLRGRSEWLDELFHLPCALCSVQGYNCELLINQSTNQPQPTNQPAKQTINQPDTTNHNQPTNQPTNQPKTNKQTD